MTSERAAKVAIAERPWSGWTFTEHGGKWHRVEYDSRTKTSTLVCTGRVIPSQGIDVLDYRWGPDLAIRCLRCAPLGWVCEP